VEHETVLGNLAAASSAIALLYARYNPDFGLSVSAIAVSREVLPAPDTADTDVRPSLTLM